MSKGGRGGRVIEVTTLADAIPAPVGSLRACVEAAGPRTCVFKVAGTIELANFLWIDDPYLTVAGQTAPGGGIQLSGKRMSSANNMIYIVTNDVVWRYTRLRKGETGSQSCTVIISDARNIIFDHNSIFWSQNELIGINSWSGETASRNITAQWNLLAEGLALPQATAMLFNGNDSKASSEAMTDIDLHHNLVANFSHRGPLLRLKRARIINNVFYNYTGFVTQLSGGVIADVIGNLYRRGPMETNGMHEITVTVAGTTFSASGSPSLYASGNKGPYNADPANDNWASMVREVPSEGNWALSQETPLSTSFRRLAPLAPAGIPISVDSEPTVESALHNTVGAYRRLGCDGSWIVNRDAADERVVSYYRAGTATCSGQCDSEIEAGGFPLLASGTPCTDSDHDGMPDTFETARGLNPNYAADGNVVGPDGYTNLERYLNGI